MRFGYCCRPDAQRLYLPLLGVGIFLCIKRPRIFGGYRLILAIFSSVIPVSIPSPTRDVTTLVA